MVFVNDFDPDRMAGIFENQGSVVFIVLFYLVVFISSLFLQIISRSSSTLGISRAELGVTPITFVDLIKDGFQYFWRVLGISVLIALFILAFFVAFSICTAVLSFVTMGLAAICIQPLFLLMIPLFLLITAVMEQAEAAVVVDGMSAMDSVRRGYELVRGNPGTYILITIIIYFGMNILVSIVIFPFMIPFMFFMFNNMEAGMDFSNIIRMQAVFMVVLLPLMTLVQGAALTYMKSAMMITYLRHTRPTESQPVLLQEATA